MERFGIVALETSACGLLVVASNLEGIKDAVKDGGNGFLVKPYDSKGVINARAELLGKDKKEREGFGERAGQFLLWKIMLGRMLLTAI